MRINVLYLNFICNLYISGKNIFYEHIWVCCGCPDILGHLGQIPWYYTYGWQVLGF